MRIQGADGVTVGIGAISHSGWIAKSRLHDEAMIGRLLRLWFGTRGPVTRQQYLVSGVVLLVFKYALEAAIYAYTTGGVLSVWSFAGPLVMKRADVFGEVGAWVVLLLSVPFIWIGLTMSFRRASDAGMPAVIGMLFLLPTLNWLLMACLSCAPSRPSRAGSVASVTSSGPAPVHVQHTADDSMTRMQGVCVAFVAGCAIAAAMVALSVYVLHSYGAALFVATPVVMGLVSAAIAGHYRFSFMTSIAIGQAALAVCLLGMVAVAAEGVVCIAMAWPIAAPLVFFGSLLGWSLGGRGGHSGRTLVLLAVLSLPTLAWQDTRQGAPALRAVTTAVEIAAPAEVVWRYVVSFPDLPAPDGIFALGIACPLRAHIIGSGVGAVRSCEFTTGSFIEPITVWEPGRRLAFDVVAQPPAMRELSVWPEVKAPHLDGYLSSRRGQFRLIAEPNHRTRLEGTTWYEVDVHPEAYWSLWANAFIHDIHQRVLRHIARLAEADALAAGGSR